MPQRTPAAKFADRKQKTDLTPLDDGTTIVFKRALPDQLFSSLRGFVLARSSEERRLTIRIEHPIIHCLAFFNPNAISAEHMVWLRQHVNVEIGALRA